MNCEYDSECVREGRKTRGMCHYHYKKALESGEILKLEPDSDEARFWSKVNKQGGYPDFSDTLVRVTPEAGECWVWTAATQSKWYGRFKIAGKLEMSTRVSLRLAGVAVQDGLDVDHLCRRPICVNPAHLEAVTRRENTLRGAIMEVNRGRRRGMCSKGHPLAGGNLILNGEYAPKCRTCQNDKNREWMRQYRARPGTTE